MKKLFGKSWMVLGLVLVFMLQTLAMGAMAADDPLGDIAGEIGEQKEISISFQLGNDVLMINGNEVKVEKPVEINGTTLVPLRVISEAFGAQVDWNGDDESVTLTYSDVVIKVWIGKKDCLVGNEQATLLEAPILQNDTTMVPLRFISENFGADVGYDGASERVTVVKKIVNDNSVKDFAMILKKSNKEKVGDSFYGWSLKMTKKYALVYRNFNGTETAFANDDGTEQIVMNVLPILENESLESVTNRYVKSDQFGILQDKESKTVDGVKMNRLTYKKGNELAIMQLGMKEDYSFMMIYGADDVKAYNAHKQDVLAQLDSLSLNYKQEGDVEDLSDVNHSGLREYQNKDYGVKFGVIPDWYDLTDQENLMTFGNLSTQKEIPAKTFRLVVTSAESGMTVEKWVNSYKEEQTKLYNSKYVTTTELSDVTNGAGTWKAVMTEIKSTAGKMQEKAFFQIRDGYKYFVEYNMQKRDATTENLPLSEIDKMFESIEIGTMNKEAVGHIIDKTMMDEEVTYRTVTGTENWTAEIPDEWVDVNASGAEVWGNPQTGGSFGVSVDNRNVSYSQAASAYDNYMTELQKDKVVTSLTSSDSKLGGITCRKYVMLRDLDGETVHYEVYVTVHNGKVYEVSLALYDYLASDYNLAQQNKILESFKFTN